MDDQLKNALRQAYDSSAYKREAYELPPWRIDERQDFLQRLQQEGRTNLLEIGAGVGRDSKYFQDNGLNVVCTDLSPQMIALCRAKGLEAYVMDFFNLDFPADHFDALYAINCLLHVPKKDLPAVLEAIKQPLNPSALFLLGVYGGISQESVWEEDDHDPKRFYAFYTDDELHKAVSKHFTVVDIKKIPIIDLKQSGLHFQRFLLRKG